MNQLRNSYKILLFVLMFLMVVGSLFILSSRAKAASPSPTALGADCTTSDGKPGIQTGPGCVPKSMNPSLNSREFQASGSGTYGGTCDELSGVMSNGFVKQILCPLGSTGNAVEVIIRNISNYLLGLAMFVFAIMLGLGFVQVMTGGGSPEALKAGKKRITLALSSIALFVVGRVFLDIIGVTGGTFLGVDIKSFNISTDKSTINELIGAVWTYVQYTGGVLAVFMIIYGGFVMLTSAGNPQRIQGARRVITYAVIGLVGLIATGLVVELLFKALGAQTIGAQK